MSTGEKRQVMTVHVWGGCSESLENPMKITRIRILRYTNMGKDKPLKGVPGLTPELRWQLQVLELNDSALPTIMQIRRAYRRLSLGRHPDKGARMK